MNQGATEARRALEEVNEQRQRMASNIRVPAWYALAYAAAMIVAFISPALIGKRAGHPLVLLIGLAIVVLGFLDAIVNRSARARLSIHNFRAYPSVRGPLYAMVAAIVAGSAITWLTLENISRGAALACGILAAVAVLAARAWTLVAVRRDIGSGEVG